MKTNLIIGGVLVVLVAVGVGLWFVDGDDDRSTASEEQDEKELVLESSVSSFGALDTTRLYADRTFIMENDMAGRIEGEEDEDTCYEGTISEGEYDDIIALLEAENFFDLEITQESEEDLQCEGGIWMTASVGERENTLRLPCVGEFTEETRAIEATMDDINSEMRDILADSREVCEQE